MRSLIRRPFIRWITILTIIVFILLLPKKILHWRYASQIYDPESAPSRRLAIVFGAGLRRDGNPTDVLADRVEVAVDLYQRGCVSELLMSGSAHPRNYDEPGAMRALALGLGVPEEHILIDRGGSRTYETCRRARELFHADQVLLISQNFHLPRALVICQALGMDAIGVRADQHSYRTLEYGYWHLREIPATLVALWDSFLSPWLKETPRPPS
jgi:SanA protein